MLHYAAFLGHQPLLSLSELHAALPGLAQPTLVSKQVATFSVPTAIAPGALATWGGTMLLAERLNPHLTLADVPGVVVDALRGFSGKATFALRAEGVSPRAVAQLYRDTKTALKKAGMPSRYVGNEHQPAASALLRDAGLIDGSGGCEIVLLRQETGLWVGRTIAVQDPDAYTLRDMKKPVRDTRAGLLPPKLAQVLLNLGLSLLPPERRTQQLTIFDPFCGTGVIPIEALLRQWHVLGSDLSAKAVTGCETNLEWARKTYKIAKKDVSTTVWKQDATKPFTLKELPDLVVTETMLGPALTNRPMAKDVRSYASEVADLELGFLENAAATLPGVPLVVTWPVWYQKTGPVHVERAWKGLAKLGYEAVPPPGLPINDPAMPSLIYRRGDQFVGREIVLLKPRSTR
jgi:hypothetical protein